MDTATPAPSDLMPTLRALSRADKMRVIQYLLIDLARDEGIPLLEAGAAYPIWSPFDAHDAGASLLKMLEAERPA
jgi:hypothetical protein